MPIDKPLFRKVLGSFAAGVTVITTVDGERNPLGLTATAFSSVSILPPLVLICVDKHSETYPCFEQSRLFAVNILAADQADVSQRFATSGGDKFAGVAWRRGSLGLPLIEGAIGYLECRLEHAYEGGDHTIYVGQVETAEARDGEPLLYFRAAYRGLQAL